MIYQFKRIIEYSKTVDKFTLGDACSLLGVTEEFQKSGVRVMLAGMVRDEYLKRIKDGVYANRRKDE